MAHHPLHWSKIGVLQVTTFKFSLHNFTESIRHLNILYTVYLLDVWDFVGRLVTEEELDGMFAGHVWSTDPRR